MEILAREIEGEVKLEAVEYLDECFDMDFEDEEARKAYLHKFEMGWLGSYGVIKYSWCKCCEQWKQEDSLWSIHAESPNQAIEYFKNY